MSAYHAALEVWFFAAGFGALACQAFCLALRTGVTSPAGEEGEGRD